LANASKVHCQVANVIERGEGTYVVELDPLSRIPRFKAGQFLHLTVDEYDPAGGFWPESRVFSIASRSGAERIKIVYSVKGRYTRRMEEALAPGREIWVKLPFGDFIIDSRIRQGSDVVIAAGGTGISPFIPFLESVAETGATAMRICLYYGLRNPGQLLFEDLLTSVAARGLADIRLRLESGEGAGPLYASALAGRLDPPTIYGECLDLHDPVFFLSGPPAMIANFKSALLDKGLEADRIQTDEWE
jgi:NAD(P)H-flavin reductase